MTKTNIIGGGAKLVKSSDPLITLSEEDKVWFTLHSTSIMKTSTAGRIPFTITITQSANQKITVTVNGVEEHTETFTAYYWDTITCSIKADANYQAGELNIISTIVKEDIEIHATDAKLNAVTFSTSNFSMKVSHGGNNTGKTGGATSDTKNGVYIFIFAAAGGSQSRLCIRGTNRDKFTSVYVSWFGTFQKSRFSSDIEGYDMWVSPNVYSRIRDKNSISAAVYF